MRVIPNMRTAPVACPAAARRSSIGAAAARATLQQQHNTQQHLRTGGDNTEPRPDATTSASGRRAALLGLGAAAAALLAAPGASRAAGDAPQAGALEEYVAQEAKGKLKDRRQLDEFRCALRCAVVCVLRSAAPGLCVCAIGNVQWWILVHALLL
jgi:hypothetical protein